MKSNTEQTNALPCLLKNYRPIATMCCWLLFLCAPEVLQLARTCVGVGLQVVTKVIGHLLDMPKLALPAHYDTGEVAVWVLVGDVPLHRGIRVVALGLGLGLLLLLFAKEHTIPLEIVYCCSPLGSRLCTSVFFSVALTTEPRCES